MIYCDLSAMPDKELIKMYRCTKCTGSNINKGCSLCHKALLEFNKRHEDVLNVYAFKLWKEFRLQDSSKEVEDYKEELRFKMLENLNTKINIEKIDNNYKPERMFSLTYMSLRTRYAYNKQQKHAHNFHECSFDKLELESSKTYDGIHTIMHKTIERITKNSSEDFTERICENIDFENRFKGLKEAERFLLDRLMDGWKQKDIAKEMKCSQPQITAMKRKIAQKLYNIK